MYKCGRCENTFLSNFDLLNHRKKEHSTEERRIICVECGKSVHHANIKIHMKSHEKNVEMIQCAHCPKMVAAHNMAKHVAGTHDPQVCPECGRKFNSKTLLGLHFQAMHVPDSQKKYRCRFCPKGFVDRGRWNHHENTHTGEKPFKCKTCGERFKAAPTLFHHNRNVHGKKQSETIVAEYNV